MNEHSELLSDLIQHRATLEAMVEMLMCEVASVDLLVKRVNDELNDASRRVAKAETPEHMTVSAAARYLGMGRGTVYELIGDDSVVHRKDPKGRTVLLKSELDEWLARGKPRNTAALQPATLVA